jgi:large subunit ribosomal protein L3
MKFILAQKEAMSQIFADNGRVIPVTVLSAGPVAVTQVKTLASDKYAAVQVGYGQRHTKNINKPGRGHLKLAAGAKTGWRHLREWRLADDAAVAEYTLGQTLDASVFAPGDVVQVAGISKGKGFQGVVKRHGFAGGPRTHGQKHSEREPGSIGGGLRTRVPKGMRMAGRMGGERISVKNLTVVAVDKDKNQIMIEGAVPGRRGTIVEIKTQSR